MKSIYFFFCLTLVFIVMPAIAQAQDKGSDEKDQPSKKSKPAKEKQKKSAKKSKQLSIVYDFCNDTLYPDREYWVRERDKVTYCIKNINLLLYDVTINKEKADYTDEATLPGNNSDLKNNLRSFSSDFQGFLSQIRENIGVINNTEIIRNLKKENEDKLKKVSLQVDSAIDAGARLKDTVAINLKITGLETGKKDLLVDTIKNKVAIVRIRFLIDSLSNAKRTLKKEVSDEKSRLLNRLLTNTDPESISTRIGEKMKEIDANFATYQNIIIYYENLLAILYQSLSEESVTYGKLIEDRRKVTKEYFPFDEKQMKEGKGMLPQIVDAIYGTKKALIQNTKELLALTYELQTSLDTYEKEKQKDNNSKTALSPSVVAEIAVSKLKLTNLSQLLISIANYNKIDELSNEIQILYKAFEKYTFKVCEKQFDMSGIDNLKYTTEIKPASGLKNVRPLRKESFDFNVNTYGGIKFDISVGAYFNFGLNDHSYFYEHTTLKDTLGAVISDLVKIKKKNDPNQYLPFVGTQLNVYWRLAPAHWGSGFNLGVSTNASDIRMYLGLIQVFGKKERIVLSGGIVGGKIKTLSGQYQENTSYDYTAANFPSTPEMVDSYKIGAYVSFTFNLLNRKGRSLFGPKDSPDK